MKVLKNKWLFGFIATCWFLFFVSRNLMVVGTLKEHLISLSFYTAWAICSSFASVWILGVVKLLMTMAAIALRNKLNKSFPITDNKQIQNLKQVNVQRR